MNEEHGIYSGVVDIARNGVDEVIRLRALNAELVEALRCADAMLSGANMDAKAVERKVAAALAKVQT